MEQAVDLFDRAFVDALGLHDLEDHRHIERNHRNGGAGLGDHRLHHAHVRTQATRLMAIAKLVRRAIDMLLGLAQRAVPVDRPGDRGTDVAIGDGGRVVGQHASVGQRIDPHGPVFAAHDGDGVLHFLLVGRLDGGLHHFVLVGVHGRRREGVAHGLQRRTHQRARLTQLRAFRKLAHRRGQGIDDEIDLAAHLVFDDLDGLRTRFVGEGIAVDRFREQAGFAGQRIERVGVVPTGRAGLVFARGLLEEDTQGRRTVTERGSDARGQTVARGGADDEDVFRSLGELAAGLGDGDLFLDILRAARGVGGDADEASDLGFDDHG